MDARSNTNQDGGNRLHLNFNANERLPAPDRAYPTTPSTFPQPVFSPPPLAQQPYATGPSSQPPQQQQHQPYAPGYAPASQGYYLQSQSQYPPAYPSSQQANDYAHAQNARVGANDPNAGLAQQFSHQNLAGAARAQYGPRGPSPSPRPRTAGSSGQPYPSHAHAPMPPQAGVAAEFQPAPERNPDRYGSNANGNQKKCSQLAADFFKDSVKRARERNQRCVPSSAGPVPHPPTPP